MAELKACIRCGDKEFRHHGFCSEYCRDIYDEEQKIIALQSELDTLKQSVKEAVEEIEAKVKKYHEGKFAYHLGETLNDAIKILHSHGLIGKE